MLRRPKGSLPLPGKEGLHGAPAPLLHQEIGIYKGIPQALSDELAGTALTGTGVADQEKWRSKRLKRRDKHGVRREQTGTGQCLHRRAAGSFLCRGYGVRLQFYQFGVLNAGVIHRGKLLHKNLFNGSNILKGKRRVIDVAIIDDRVYDAVN